MEQQKSEVNRTLFSAWISDPSGIGFADSREIESMAGRFPYCQILQSLNAKSLQRQNAHTFEPALAKASLQSPDRRVLFNLVNHPEKLIALELITQPEEDIYHEVIEEDYYGDDQTQDDLAAEQRQPEFTKDQTVNAEIENENPIEGEGSASEISDQQVENIETEEPLTTEYKAAGIEEMGEEDKMIIENIASADFFAFEEKLDFRQTDPDKATAETSKEQNTAQPEIHASPNEQLSATHDVARYDDEGMPYTFLWWLHRTRQEHAETYQPYVDFKLDTSQQINKKPGEELNQQIIENIFHLQSPLDEMEIKNLPQTVHFEVRRKEEAIIEKFIREEPQIHPPSPDKLDMENKARKSAEDPNDLVSETLATIYTEQMLFHKAIDTYQKLSLKFPEKRAYFADQISELKKKIN